MHLSSRSQKAKKGYQRGVWAENMAAFWLRCKGYRILERRYKTPFGEIDLIAMRRKEIVFVEVKYRNNFRDALEALQPQQRRRIENASQMYMSSSILKSVSARFDVCVFSRFGYMEHIKNAWRVGD